MKIIEVKKSKSTVCTYMCMISYESLIYQHTYVASYDSLFSECPTLNASF